MHPLECAACTAAAGGTCCFLTCLICNPAKTIELSKMLCCISSASDSISSTAQTTTAIPEIDSEVVLPGFNGVVLAILDESTSTIPITQNSASAAAASEAQSSSSSYVEERPQISVQGLSYGFPFSDLIRNIKNCVIRSYSKHCFAGVKTSLNAIQRGALQDALTANGVNTDNITDDKLDAIQLALHFFLLEGQTMQEILSNPTELKNLITRFIENQRFDQATIDLVCGKLRISSYLIDSNDMQKLNAFLNHYISKYPDSLSKGLNFHIHTNNDFNTDIDDFLSSYVSRSDTAPVSATIDRS